MKGACHCGAVVITLAAQPDYLNDCNCTLCSKAGAIWGYFSTGQVTITGETSSYTRIDREQPSVFVHFCPRCGNTTHWTLTPHIAQDRMGVNMRLFDPADVKGITLHFPDGRNWNGSRPPEMRQPSVIC